MISLGDDWMLWGSEIYHACGPELLHHWDGNCVCDCGSPVPQRVEAFHRWLGEQQRRSRTQASAARRERPLAEWRLSRFDWHL